MKLEPKDLEAWVAYFKLLAEIEARLNEDNAKIEETSGGSEGL
jgi:hypothetical protein